MATPFDGPNPGRAPIIVPKTQPIMARAKVVGVRATWNPNAKLLISSIVLNHPSW